MENNIPVMGHLVGVEETVTKPNEDANQGSLTEETVVLKSSNSYLPQTNSYEALPLSLIGFVMCITIMLGYGIRGVTSKKE